MSVKLSEKKYYENISDEMCNIGLTPRHYRVLWSHTLDWTGVSGWDHRQVWPAIKLLFYVENVTKTDHKNYGGCEEQF